MTTLNRVIERFQAAYQARPAFVARAPGRVNLLGEHVDYNDGWVFPAAIDRATYVAFSTTDENQCTLWAADYDQEATFSPQTLSSDPKHDPSEVPDWARYPAGVAWAFLQKGLAT